MHKKNYQSSKNQAFCQFELTKRLYTTDFFSKFNLNNTTKLVLFALTNHYNIQNEDMFPSQRYMAQQLGISEKSVERAIKELATNNLIVYLTKKVNRYKFTSKFFDSLKMSELDRQNVGNDHRQNVGLTYNFKNINNNNKNNFKIQSSEISPQNEKSLRHTELLLKKIRNDKQNACSPLDFSKDEAIHWLNSLRPEFHNSFFAKEICKKFNLNLPQKNIDFINHSSEKVLS